MDLYDGRAFGIYANKIRERRFDNNYNVVCLRVIYIQCNYCNAARTQHTS